MEIIQRLQVIHAFFNDRGDRSRSLLFQFPFRYENLYTRSEERRTREYILISTPTAHEAQALVWVHAWLGCRDSFLHVLRSPVLSSKF